MPKIKQSTMETIVNENGKKELRRNIVLQWEDEPPYVKMYLDTILYLKDLPKGYNSILLALLKHMTYADSEDGQCIFINSSMKKRIASSLEISISRIDNVLSELHRGEVLTRIDRGMYRVNPHLFGKGDWQDIARLRLEIIFDNNGKTIMGNIEKKKINTPIEGQMTLGLTGTEN